MAFSSVTANIIGVSWGNQMAYYNIIYLLLYKSQTIIARDELNFVSLFIDLVMLGWEVEGFI